VLTIPNVISLVRLLCVPLFLWLLWGPENEIAAAVLLAALGASDWIDGYIARHFDQGSELGKVLDPTADRVLLVAGAIALLTQPIPTAVTVLVWIILVREVVIAVATVTLGVMGARRIDVVWAGKAGTLAIMFALPMFIVAANVHGNAKFLWNLVGWGFAIGGAVLGYYAAASYVPAARAALREGRADRVENDVAPEVGAA
jgi:cardiolipin synthase